MGKNWLRAIEHEITQGRRLRANNFHLAYDADIIELLSKMADGALALLPRFIFIIVVRPPGKTSLSHIFSLAYNNTAEKLSTDAGLLSIPLVFILSLARPLSQYINFSMRAS
jgi:hypothetical protein